MTIRLHPTKADSYLWHLQALDQAGSLEGALRLLVPDVPVHQDVASAQRSQTGNLVGPQYIAVFTVIECSLNACCDVHQCCDVRQ